MSDAIRPWSEERTAVGHLGNWSVGVREFASYEVLSRQERGWRSPSKVPRYVSTPCDRIGASLGEGSMVECSYGGSLSKCSLSRRLRGVLRIGVAMTAILLWQTCVLRLGGQTNNDVETAGRHKTRTLRAGAHEALIGSSCTPLWQDEYIRGADLFV